jgi:XTP/dITP diphosphohydrolase
MKIVFATHNPGKVTEMKALLPGFDVISAEDAGVFEDVIEDGKSFSENALKKARFVAKQTKQWSVADDSGICIAALDGAPGIMSARWAGEDSSDMDKVNLTLKKMKNIPEGKRDAWIEARIALVSPDGQEWIFSGRIDGQVASAPRGQNRPKLPYDLIFVPDGETRTLAEITNEEKNAISHRGQAFKKLKDFLEKLNNNKI